MSFVIKLRVGCSVAFTLFREGQDRLRDARARENRVGSGCPLVWGQEQASKGQRLIHFRPHLGMETYLTNAGNCEQRESSAIDAGETVPFMKVISAQPHKQAKPPVALAPHAFKKIVHNALLLLALPLLWLVFWHGDGLRWRLEVRERWPGYRLPIVPVQRHENTQGSVSLLRRCWCITTLVVYCSSGTLGRGRGGRCLAAHALFACCFCRYRSRRILALAIGAAAARKLALGLFRLVVFHCQIIKKDEDVTDEDGTYADIPFKCVQVSCEPFSSMSQGWCFAMA